MRFADILKMCFDSLSRRKGRTILTVLGVFIGCTSIIVMVSIGAGMQESYDQMLKNMGDLSIIEVYRGYNQNTGTQTESKLDEKAVESFREIAGVQDRSERSLKRDWRRARAFLQREMTAA